jgi:prefoldin subunit 5
MKKKRAKQTTDDVAATVQGLDAQLTQLLKKLHQLRAVLRQVQAEAEKLPTIEHLQQLREAIDAIGDSTATTVPASESVAPPRKPR